MKKILYVLLFVVLCFIGCVPVPNGTDTILADKTKNHIIVDDYYDVEVFNVTYNGHRYLIFNTEYRLGVVHDPDCPCHIKRDTIIKYVQSSLNMNDYINTDYYGTGY